MTRWSRLGGVQRFRLMFELFTPEIRAGHTGVASLMFLVRDTPPEVAYWMTVYAQLREGGQDG